MKLCICKRQKMCQLWSNIKRRMYKLNQFSMLPKSKSISLSLPLLELLAAYSPSPFSWSSSFKPTHSLSSTSKLNHPLSTTIIKLNPANSTNFDDKLEEGKIMTRKFKLSRTFRSIKPHSTPNPNPNSKIELENVSETAIESSIKNPSWRVYLIVSTNPPFKTYVGVSTDFSRRLKQHNGELKGGAKASRAGRPWICACLVQGFKSQSEACEFESKWKTISRKLPRRQKSEGKEGLEDKGRLLLLQHRHAAMEKLKQSFDCDHLEVDWQLNPSS